MTTEGRRRRSRQWERSIMETRPGAPVAPYGRCPECGRARNEHDEFCRACGTRMSAPNPSAYDTRMGTPAPSAPGACPQCGHVADDPARAVFCPECGHRLKRTCRECGTPVTEGGYCPQCGKKERGKIDPTYLVHPIGAIAAFIVGFPAVIAVAVLAHVADVRGGATAAAIAGWAIGFGGLLGYFF